MSYANLHTRTTFSTGLAIGTSADVIARAKEAGLSAVAITDHCTMAGALDFYQEGKKAGFPVIIGAEVLYFDDTYDSRTKYSSLVLLAKDQEGYRNLCQLVSLSNQDNRFDGGPKLSIEDLKSHRDGLVCLTSNISGPVGRGFLNKEMEHKDAIRLADIRVRDLQSIFKDDLFMELVFNDESYQPFELEFRKYELRKAYNVNPQTMANSLTVMLGTKYGIKCLATSDASMPKQDQKILLDIVLNNSPWGKPAAEGRWIMSAQEMKEKSKNGSLHESSFRAFGAIEHLNENSLEAARRCTGIDLKFKPQVVNYPHILHPLGRGQTKMELVMDILKENGRVPFADDIYRERLLYEIKAVTANGRINLIDYFLVLEDLCRWCRDNGIVVGPGRGSGAGSLLNYGLRITHLDPIKYGLLFERFISEGRIQKGTLPDVDLDFSDQEAVRAYLVDKYGVDRVRSIGVMQTLRLKNAVKDAFKALHPELEFHVVNGVSTKLPKQEIEETEHEYYARCLEESPLFAQLMDKHPKAKDAVGRLIGFNRQPGVHPCGLAITQDPLESFSPLRQLKGKWALEYGADDAAFCGIIKYDILALTTLKYFKTCLELIEQRRGEKVDIYSIPLDDSKTLRAFELGDTESVFQFNSEVAISILMKIDVRSVDDLSLVTSVGRPGPMANGQHFEFIKRARGEERPVPPHPLLAEILQDSYGIMIYQEGVMKAAQILGGFSLAEADDIRKAMGKKEAKYIKPYKDRFVEHAAKSADITNHRAEEIWHLMETFSGYGFNKSHSMSYALIGYICQYLKVHYPQEWWTACLENATDTEHVGAYYSAAKDKINLPDINASSDHYTIRGDGLIQMPFSCVKGIGDSACAEISAKRPFQSFDDFFARVNRTKCNKKVVVQLISAGAFASFEKDKARLISRYYELREEKLPEEYAALGRMKLAQMESDALSFIVPNYYEIYPEAFDQGQTNKFSDFKKSHSDLNMYVAGRVEEIKSVPIKKGASAGKSMYRVTIVNCGESMQVTVWPELYQMYHSIIEVGNVLKVEGTISFYYDVVQMTCVRMIDVMAMMKGKT